MGPDLRTSLTLLIALGCVPVARSATPQTAAFTYQGVLKQSGALVNGSVDLRFALFDAAVAGNAVGAPEIIAPIAVVQGLFTTSLDFGALAWNGEERWLEIGVSSPNNGNGPFTTLTPRQKLASTPYAAFALQAALSGTYASSVNFNNAGNQFAGSFSGSGAGLTNIDPANLAAGAAGINITGNAATATSATSATSATTAGNVTGIVAIANGGTGANDAATARTNLGAAATSHTHAAADIASGNLAIARLPTGGAWSLSSALNLDAGALVIDPSTNSIGLGTAAPAAPLHVMEGSAGAVTPVGSASLALERNSHNYLQLLAPDASESGVLFGNPTNGNAAGGVLFNTPGNANGLQFRTNTNDAQMVITSAGNVGIGTTAPTNRLHVAGFTRVDGDAAVNGDLTCESIALEAPVMRRMSFSGAHFLASQTDGMADGITLPDGTVLRYLWGATYATVPVNLPDGAVVTKVTFTVQDVDPSENWRCMLICQSITSPTTNSATMADVSTSGAPGIVTLQDTSIASATVNNGTFGYFFRLQSTNFVQVGSVYGAIIEYTITSPLP